MKQKLFDFLRPFCETDDFSKEFIPSVRETNYNDDEPKYCICGTKIVELCYILHIKSGNQFIVGNECINYFEFNPICTKCHIYECSSNTATQCNECHKGKKGKAPTNLVLLKKHKNETYLEAYRDKSWCEWVRDKMDSKYDIHFVNWLKRMQKIEQIKKNTI